MENIETLLAAVAQSQGFDEEDSTSPELGFRNLDNREGKGMEELNGVKMESLPLPLPPREEVVVPAIQVSDDKRKRGRPNRGQMVAKSPPPKRKKQEDEEEDVCFICFDGGSLVLCDRKGCPKAYHPACIKRDEAFFQSKAKWNCGWHICSVCRRNSHYVCYSCTYSLCKGCTKDADFVCVRRNKGFCSTCMKTIMLIEIKDEANSDSVKVDFDDKTSWEYLFKMYWVYLKDKYSLKLSELTQAKKPWKAGPVDGKVSVMKRCSERITQDDRIKIEPLVLDNHVETINNVKEEGPSSYYTPTLVPSIDRGTDEPGIEKTTDKPGMKDEVNDPGIVRDADKSCIQKDVNKPSIVEDVDMPDIAMDGNNPSIAKFTDKPSNVVCTDKPSDEKDINNPVIIENANKPNIEDENSPRTDIDRPGICENRDETGDNDSAKPEIGTEWATKDLLEFVAHMKNGDKSALSQLDVQMLLLEYIKRNNLRDPRRKSQIICDLRLQNLFGKARVGHIEMLKLLEFHFLIKEDAQKNSFVPAGFAGSAASIAEIDENNYGSSIPMKGRKRKTRKKSEAIAPQNNLNEYAAIDLHNINLIYLRRNLMENLIEDKENFNDKVVGAIVRIRISSIDQKPDIYRLVQVVGTNKVAEPYKIGDRTADVMLEVLNLDKKEVVSIDAISNQEFTEDECRRLRQSIRCGLVKQFIVGDVQKKAMALQPVRLNDGLEAEILRLNHLRDRASENGRKKELREYVDKLQLLKSPEERQRRITEIPVIHADPKMDPNYESEEDFRSSSVTSKKDTYTRPSYSGRTGKPVSPDKKGKEEPRNLAHNRMMLGKRLKEVNATNSAIRNGNDQTMPNSVLETSVAAASPSAYIIETEKLWHYRDPNGKIQGPFSMMQLRKWSTTGLFPSEMRIWTNHEQYDSLLLTDALNGQFHGASELPHKSSLDSQERHATGIIEESETNNGTKKDSEQTEAAAMCNHATDISDSTAGLVREVESGSSSWPQCFDLLKQNNSSTEGVQTDIAPSDPGKEPQCLDLLEKNNSSTEGVQTNIAPSDPGKEPQCLDLLEKNNSSTEGVQTNIASSDPGKEPQCLDLLKQNNSSTEGVQTNIAPSDIGKESGDDNHGSQNVEKNSIGLTHFNMTSENDHQNHSFIRAEEPLSSEINLCSLPINLSSIDKETDSVIAPEPKSGDTIKQDGNIDIPDLSSPTTNLSNKQEFESSGVGIQSSGIFELFSLAPNTSNNQQSEPCDVGIQSSNILELLSLSPTTRSSDEDQVVHATETKQSGLMDFPVIDSNTSWSTVASCLANSAQLPEVASEWCGYSPTPTKQPTQEWVSGLASESSIRPPDLTTENMATSNPAGLSWLEMLNGPIELDVFGEESVSDLLAEVETMESQGGFPSPTSAMKFAKEFIQDCNNDCFSSIEDFNPTHNPARSDAFSSNREVQFTAESSVPCKPNEAVAAPMHPFDFFMRSSMHSSASSEGETNAPVYSGEAGSEFHPPPDMVAPNVAPSMGTEPMDPGWGSVQGNINLVTVQGNVNLVLGPGQGMANLFGTNPGTSWANPNLNHNPMNVNVSLPWDGQRMYGGGERFTSPREWAYQGRPPWGGGGGGGRQQYGGGGGYPRPPPKGQRVCKFYESGRCKKGAFCDYLHP